MSSGDSMTGGHSSKKVRVIVRTRPTAKFASNIIKFDNDSNKGKSINIYLEKANHGFINNQQEEWCFKLDNVLHNASQEAVFDATAKELLPSVMDGYNGTVLAYGQTGAGKTFTMTGTTENYKHRGIIPRTIAALFREIGNRTHSAVTVRISYLEIYNETMFDLLSGMQHHGAGSCNKASLPTLTIAEDSNGMTVVKGLTCSLANTEEEALNMVFEGETFRAISPHNLNRNSSRSHCIFTIHIESRSRVESSENITISKLNLVDLAGSERLAKTNSQGRIAQEAVYINKSLTFLEQVVLALSDRRRDHIPYRQTLLTNVLKDSLGGNCNTLMIANIWGESDHIEETISTLRFATRMMRVSTTPQVNLHYDSLALVKRYEREIRQLKQELAMHDTLANRSHVSYEPYTDTQRQELQRQVRSFIDGNVDELDVQSLRQMRETFTAFRQVVRSVESEMTDVIRQRNVLRNAPPTVGPGPAGVGPTPTVTGGDGDGGIVDNSGGASVDENGVGDLEGGGFGIGVAAANAKPTTVPIGGSKRGGGRRSKHSAIEGSGGVSAAGAIGGGTGAPNASATGTPSASVLPISDINIVSTTQPSTVIDPLPDRADAFETFKAGPGAELSRILGENKAALKEKRHRSRELAFSINSLKEQVDSLRMKLEMKQASKGYNMNEITDESDIIDEEEFSLLKQVKDLKQRYRNQFEELQGLRSESEYCSQLVDQCRARLISQFEVHYQALYGEMSATDTGGKEGESGTFDDEERFESLQMQRLIEEHPESCAFYNAKRNTDRRMYVATANKGAHSRKKAPSPTLKTLVRNNPPSVLQFS